MRVAMLSPVAWRTPPRHYGPWEQVVSSLTEGLVKRGVDVTLFATADSVTSARLQAVVPRGWEEDSTLDPKVQECLHISEVFERADEFDLIHNHFDFLPLTYSGLVSTPVVTTIHGFSSEKILAVYRKYNGRAFYVAISNADRHPHLDYLATVYHGIDPGLFTFRAEPQTADPYLVFFGRIHHDKGAREAIEIARRCGIRLVMAGIVQDRAYYAREVEPHIDGRAVSYVGSVGSEHRDSLLGGALALLHPINFAEPFGLAVVEAMACGTPVIAFRKGSMPEIVEDGLTGFLVDSVEGAVEAVGRVGEIDRASCRAHVETRFTVDRMVEGYLEVYERVLAQSCREERRPWGRFVVLDDSPSVKVKRLEVQPGRRLSLQRHRFRDEHWVVVSGEAVVRRDAELLHLHPGESVDIHRGQAHRLENRGTDLLAVVEVQRGDYCGEDDIERLEDDFGRVG